MKTKIDARYITPESEKMWDKMWQKILWRFSPRQIVRYFWDYLKNLEENGLIEFKDGEPYWIEEIL